MEFLTIVVLGIVQGLTEFLPISSSGHLVVVEDLFEVATGKPIDNPLRVNIVLHTGTLLAVLVVFRRRILALLGEDRRTILLLAVGTLPAAVVGILLHRFARWVLNEPLLAGCMLLATGGLLLVGGRHLGGERTYQQMSYAQAFWIGVFQAFALLPGMSRSGATIVAGLLSGLRPDAAATFSFLLAIPAIGGATLIELLELTGGVPAETPIGYLALGAGVSFAVGLLSLWWLLSWLYRGRLHQFAFWCLPVGLVVIVWQLLVR